MWGEGECKIKRSYLQGASSTSSVFVLRSGRGKFEPELDTCFPLPRRKKMSLLNGCFMLLAPKRRRREKGRRHTCAKIKIKLKRP